jgi:hypothetical protein
MLPLCKYGLSDNDQAISQLFFCKYRLNERVRKKLRLNNTDGLLALSYLVLLTFIGQLIPLVGVLWSDMRIKNDKERPEKDRERHRLKNGNTENDKDSQRDKE